MMIWNYITENADEDTIQDELINSVGAVTEGLEQDSKAKGKEKGKTNRTQ